MSGKNVLEFLMLVGQLKNVKRTGWINHEVKSPESVADHMYRMAIMTFLLKNDNKEIDSTRCLKLAVVHDLAECIVGDITPSDPMGKEEKHRREKQAMEHLASLVSMEVGSELQELYEVSACSFLEYENQATDEARAVKDLDRFEMILQAFEYEKAESRFGDLQDFFNSTKGRFTVLALQSYNAMSTNFKGKFEHPDVNNWVEELEAKRNSCLGSEVSKKQ
eukprot:gene12265-13529_t